MMDFITSYVAGPTKGGFMISYGSLFMMGLWFVWSKIRSMVQNRKGG
jgi:hypothetical protein